MIFRMKPEKGGSPPKDIILQINRQIKIGFPLILPIMDSLNSRVKLSTKNRLPETKKYTMNRENTTKAPQTIEQKIHPIKEIEENPRIFRTWV